MASNSKPEPTEFFEDYFQPLAVDRSYHALGLPFWVGTKVPGQTGVQNWNRLMIAQDTGGAIKGPLRGDVFFVFGPEAEFRAGHMNAADVALFLLLPCARRTPPPRNTCVRSLGALRSRC